MVTLNMLVRHSITNEVSEAIMTCQHLGHLLAAAVVPVPIFPHQSVREVLETQCNYNSSR